jgi:adenylyl-sulfate kinase
MGQQPATIWLTGLTGSGKTTIARALEEKLFSLGHFCSVFDGENLRMGLNRDLGFTADDRGENIRRAAEVASMFNDCGIISICALLSPSADDRATARKIVGKRFFEVFLTAPDEVRRKRNEKGVQSRTNRPSTTSYSVVAAPCDSPEETELTIDTYKLSIEDCVDEIIKLLKKNKILEG